MVVNYTYNRYYIKKFKLKYCKPLKYLLSLNYYMSFFCDKQLEKETNIQDSNEILSLQDFYKIIVIEPSDIYQYIKDNDIRDCLS